MWTSSKTAVGALGMLVPVVALCGLVGIDPAPVQPGVASGANGANHGYTLRCWQDGRLILEEQHVSMPPGVDAGNTRLRVQDRNQRPLLIAETRNATCLVKAGPPERGRSGQFGAFPLGY